MQRSAHDFNMSALRICVILTVCVGVVFCVENSTKIEEEKPKTVQIITAHGTKENESVLRAARDTYLEAYASSHGGAPVPQKQHIMARDEKYPPADFYPKPQNDYGPPVYTNEQPKVMNYHGPSSYEQQPSGPGYSYNPAPAPAPSYSSPQNSYGPPASGPPNNMYGPPMIPGSQAWPAPVYGAPSPAYGPPPSGPSFMEMPHAMMGLLDKFKMKLNIFTILKIILKLVIFKKILKFIAILCLLLFIPQFKPKEMSTMMEPENDESDDSMMMNEDDEDMMRTFGTYNSNANTRLNMLTAFVHDALATYSAKQFDNVNEAKSSGQRNCEGLYCKVLTILNNVDKKFTFTKLFTSYFRNELESQT